MHMGHISNNILALKASIAAWLHGCACKRNILPLLQFEKFEGQLVVQDVNITGIHHSSRIHHTVQPMHGQLANTVASWDETLHY